VVHFEVEFTGIHLIAMLLRYNLFTYRDLWAWIDSPLEVPPIILTGERLMLEY